VKIRDVKKKGNESKNKYKPNEKIASKPLFC